jgi:hypothetical protein
VSAFAFVMITNLLLQPVNGDWFAGTHSPIAWHRTVAAIIYPVKIILVGPLAPIFNDPDPGTPDPGNGLCFILVYYCLSIAFYPQQSYPT